MRAHVVATESFRRHSTVPDLEIRRICMSGLPDVYHRETVLQHGQLYDVPSDAPMTTQHAIARFFVPYLQEYRGWAVFTDGDVLCRADIAHLFACADDRYAVQAVQHPPMPDSGTKKAGMPQLLYRRKNWSSVMLWQCSHPANQALTLDVLNTWPGRDLHAFKWLRDDEIGSLPPHWNYLVGVTEPPPDPVALAHYTLGTPDLPGHEGDPFAHEWFATAEAAGYRFPHRQVPA